MRLVLLVLGLVLGSCVSVPNYSSKTIKNWMIKCTGIDPNNQRWCACTLVRFQAAHVPESRLIEQMRTKKEAPDLLKIAEDCQQ